MELIVIKREREFWLFWLITKKLSYNLIALLAICDFSHRSQNYTLVHESYSYMLYDNSHIIRDQL